MNPATRQPRGTLSRIKKGKGFEYLKTDGSRVKSSAEIHRINSLRIPPGYKNVVICPSPDSKVQAYGYDDKGRKQTIYNKRFIEAQRAKKFADLEGFEKVYKRIQADVESGLRSQSKDTRARLIRLIVKLAMICHLRIGNDKYVKENQSYGLTTLLCKHVHLANQQVTFDFTGKKAVRNVAICKEPAAVKIIMALKRGKRANDRLFEYSDEDGRHRVVDSAAVNEYLKSFDPNITSKDIRTWEANRLFVKYLKHVHRQQVPTSETAWRRCMRDAIKLVAERLHHTPAVCKKDYIHPGLIDQVENNTHFRKQLVASVQS